MNRRTRIDPAGKPAGIRRKGVIAPYYDGDYAGVSNGSRIGFYRRLAEASTSICGLACALIVGALNLFAQETKKPEAEAKIVDAPTEKPFREVVGGARETDRFSRSPG
jgi:hypothetical protein